MTRPGDGSMAQVKIKPRSATAELLWWGGEGGEEKSGVGTS